MGLVCDDVSVLGLHNLESGRNNLQGAVKNTVVRPPPLRLLIDTDGSALHATAEMMGSSCFES